MTRIERDGGMHPVERHGPGSCTLASAFPGSGFNGHALRLWPLLQCI